MSVVVESATVGTPVQASAQASIQASVPRSASREATDAAALSLLSLMVDLPEGSTDRQRIRTRLIEMYLPLARN